MAVTQSSVLLVMYTTIQGDVYCAGLKITINS